MKGVTLKPISRRPAASQTIQPIVAGASPLILKLHASQSADIIQALTAAGAEIWVVDSAGRFEGIPFPATQVPSADANTLDDYEEGTFTPVLTFATAGDLSVVYTRQQGVYIKIGAMVQWWLSIETSTFTYTTASGVFKVTGLPYTAAANPVWMGSAILKYTKANYTQVLAYLDPSVDFITFLGVGSGQAIAAFAAADIPTGSNPSVYASGSFKV